jgi:hypothetical protein
LHTVNKTPKQTKIAQASNCYHLLLPLLKMRHDERSIMIDLVVTFADIIIQAAKAKPPKRRVLSLLILLHARCVV